MHNRLKDLIAPLIERIMIFGINYRCCHHCFAHCLSDLNLRMENFGMLILVRRLNNLQVTYNLNFKSEEQKAKTK